MSDANLDSTDAEKQAALRVNFRDAVKRVQTVKANGTAQATRAKADYAKADAQAAFLALGADEKAAFDLIVEAL